MSESYGVAHLVGKTVVLGTTTYLDGSTEDPVSTSHIDLSSTSTLLSESSHHQYLSYEVAGAVYGDDAFTGQTETVHDTYDYQFSVDYGDATVGSQEILSLEDSLDVATHTTQDVSFSDSEQQEENGSWYPVSHDYRHNFDRHETSSTTVAESLTDTVPDSSTFGYAYGLTSQDHTLYDYSLTDETGSVTAVTQDDDAVITDDQTAIHRGWNTGDYSLDQSTTSSTETVNDDYNQPYSDANLGFTDLTDNDVATTTYAQEDVTEHAVTGGGAILDYDYSLSQVSHSGDGERDHYTWDEPTIGHGESTTSTHVEDAIKDESVLGGTVSHQVTQNGYTETVGWSDWPETFYDIETPGDSLGESWSHPNGEGTEVASYPLPDDPTAKTGELQSNIDELFNTSGLHDLIFPPPAAAPWYAPVLDYVLNTANNPWSFLTNPFGAIEAETQAMANLLREAASPINALANDLQNLADDASSNGYVGVGTLLGMGANLGHMGAGLVDLPDTIGTIANNAVLAAQRATSASGSSMVGALAGVGYFAGSFVGVTQITEGIVGEDFATGAQLDSVEAASRIFGGISALAGAATFGVEMFDLDTCLPGTPKLFKDGCFTERTVVLTGKGRISIGQRGICQRVIVDPEGSTPRLQPFIDITQWRVLRLEYVRPDTQQVLHMAFLRSAIEADQLSPGDTTPVVIEEMGVEGKARVIAIEPCPPVEEGEGELITGTFMQEHIDVRLLKLEGLEEPIEVTGVHLIYSEDQHTYVPVKDLARGERLRTRTGTAVVESILRKYGSWRVYNLEIGSVHRYYGERCVNRTHVAGALRGRIS